MRFVDSVQIGSLLLLRGDGCLVGSFNCFLDGLGAVTFRRGLLSVGAGAGDIFVERGDVAHTLFELGLAVAVSTHCDELVRPILLEFADLTSSHNDRACEC